MKVPLAGWLSLVFNMTRGLTTLCGARAAEPIRLEWQEGIAISIQPNTEQERLFPGDRGIRQVWNWFGCCWLL